jgi:hypothetical protein
MMRDKSIWGPDSNEFNPDRWLDEKASAELDHYYMPVGVSFLLHFHSKTPSPSATRYYYFSGYYN